MSQDTYMFSTYVKAPANGYDTTTVTVTPPRFSLPHGFVVGTYASFVEDFDMAFLSRRQSKTKGEHSIHQLKLKATPTITNGILSLAVDFILNKESDTSNNEKHKTYISPASYVRVLTIVTAENAASAVKKFSVDCTASVPPVVDQDVIFSSTGLASGAAVKTGLSGFEFKVSTSDDDTQDDQQIACFDITSGTADPLDLENGASYVSLVSGAYAALNDHDTASVLEAKYNDPFDSTGTFGAIITDGSSFAVHEFNSGTSTVSHDFGANVARAYTVIRNISNFGENDPSSEDDLSFNELASFTCMGPVLTVDGSSVSFDWNTVQAHWGDKLSSASASEKEIAFKSKVDLMVIAEFE